MSAAAILSELHEAGFTVRAQGERLLLSPLSRATPELRERVRAHKPAIVEALALEAAAAEEAQRLASLEAERARLATREHLEARLRKHGEGLHPLRDESGWRTYALHRYTADGKHETTGLYSTLERLCEVRGWLSDAELPPFDPPAFDAMSPAQVLRLALARQRLGVRPCSEPAAGWLTYEWDSGAPVVHAESLEALAAHYGVELPAERSE
jgi:hypothetical protein